MRDFSAGKSSVSTMIMQSSKHRRGPTESAANDGHAGHHFHIHPPGTAADGPAAGKARQKPPSLLLMMAEMRAVAELFATTLCIPLLSMAPKGDGHPVLVLPGFMAGDTSTGPLRRFLTSLGYRPYAWQMGRNLGGVYRMRRLLRDRLAEIHQETGRKVTLVGWSLGGVYARDLALSMPEHVRYVITMGSPFSGDFSANNARRLYEMVSGESVTSALPEDLMALSGDLPVPTSSIYSRMDGVVHWECSRLREHATAENIEVYGASHFGLGVNAAVLWAVADRLAQAEGSFAPFRKGGPFSLAYARAGLFG
jgi:pimeloyl-ACP methyl ester carboxylesterase